MSGIWYMLSNGFYFHCYDYSRKKEEEEGEEKKNHYHHHHHRYCYYIYYSVCLSDKIKEIDEGREHLLSINKLPPYMCFNFCYAAKR